MSGPLEGVEVLEIAQWAAVPAAAAMLADWGARVIKVEDAARGGDPCRAFQATAGLTTIKAPIDPLFEFDNRGKESIALDLRVEGSLEIIHKLVLRSDILVTNFVPEVLEKFKIDYKNIAPINPRLVYMTFNGYGAAGPEKNRPGYDYGAFWSRAGFISVLGDPDSSPVVQRPALADHATSLGIGAAILAALYNREKTDKGQEISVCLYHTGVWVLSCDIFTSLLTGQAVPKVSRREVRNPLFNLYKGKDGRWLHLLMLQPDRYWSAFCKALGEEGAKLEHDPRFENYVVRAENVIVFIDILEKILATKTRDEWGKLFDENEVLWAVCQDTLEVANDPQAIANDFYQELDHPNAGKIKMVTAPAKFYGTPSRIRSVAPAFGQHTEEVLLEVGYTWDELIRLKEQGVII